MSIQRLSPFKKYIWIILFGLIASVLFILFIQNRTNGKIESGGQTRRYLLYIPESYDPDTAAPLVISLHGFVQWPAHQKTLSGWNKLADEHAFLVVYPKGTGFPLRWNTSPDENDPEAKTRDLEFISDLIHHLNQSYNIDQTRIYANGMSNGAGMTELLACELSEQIAAVGGVAGAYLYPPEECNPSHAIPLIAFHGVDDPIVPYAGGPSRDTRLDFLPIEEWIANWADHNACSDAPEIIQVNNEIRRTVYSGCEEDADVIFYRIEGSGHTWPGGDEIPVWIAGHTNQDIDASALMWDFFNNYKVNLE